MPTAAAVIALSVLALVPAAEAFGPGGGLPGAQVFASSRKAVCNPHRAAPLLSLSMRKDGMSHAPSERRRKQSKWDDMPENIPRYEYVGGGFESAAPRQEAAANSSMYKAFDSALRAADYNMFCAPLKKVDTPSAFRAAEGVNGSSAAGGSAAQSFVEEEEDEEEVARRVAAEYAEFDRLVLGSAIESDGSARKLKRKGTASASRVRGGAKARSDEEIVADAAAAASASAAPEAAARGRLRRRGSLKGGGLDSLGGLADELRRSEEEGGDGSYSPVGEGEGSVSREEVEEGYDELQAMLGLKPKPGSRTRLNDATLRGNTTKLRQEGVFKKITLKDPLKRVYAQRLLGLKPDIGSETAVARGKSPASRDGMAGGAAADVDVAGFLDGLQRGEGVVGAGPRNPSPAGTKSPRKGGKGRVSQGAQAKPAGKAARPEELEGGQGRVVMNHSTHLEGLLPVLNRLAETRGVSTVVPARLFKAQGRARGLELRVSGPSEGGFKLLARRGSQCQEVFVVTDLDRETMEGAVAWSL